MAKIELTALISPRMVNQTRLTMNDYITNIFFASSATWLQSQVPGFQETLPLQGVDPAKRLPFISFAQNYPAIGDVAITPFVHASDLDNAFTDDWSWSRGKHFIQAGVTAMTMGKRQGSANYTNGVYNFSGRFTGNSIADFLLGDGTSFSQVNAAPRAYVHVLIATFYIEDQWKITPRLTLTFGLRESFLPLVGIQAGFEPIFVPRLYNPAAAPIVTQSGQIVSTPNYNPLNGIIINGVNGIPLNQATPKQWYALPQVGFALDVLGDGKTSLRGGYGITAARTLGSAGSQCCTGNYPLVTSLNLVNPQFPNPTGAAPAPPTVQTYNTIDSNLRAGEIQTYSLSLEHEFRGNWLASVASAGALVRHLFDEFNINQPPPTGAFGFNPAINRGGSPYFYGPYQGYGAIMDWASQLNASYNGLMLNLRHPVGHGLFLTAAYTWSHGLTPFRAPFFFTNANTQQNPYNAKSDYGNSLLNVPQVFAVTAVYDIPLFATSSGWKRALFGGWKLDEMLVIQSGISMDPALSIANQGLATRPNVVGALSYPKNVHQWFSTSTFAAPAAGYYGNAGTGVILGPGMVNFDTSLNKEFRVTELHRLELRAELFNTFNHTNFSSVNTTFGSSAFGFITGARDPRIVEFALRYRF